MLNYQRVYSHYHLLGWLLYPIGLPTRRLATAGLAGLREVEIRTPPGAMKRAALLWTEPTSGLRLGEQVVLNCWN